MDLGPIAYLFPVAVLVLLAVRVYFDAVHESRLGRPGWSAASMVTFPVGFLAFLVYRYVIHPARRASRPANPIVQD
jgi:hypothetical protein